MFKVKVGNPLREEKDCGLKKGEVLTVYYVVHENQIGGPFIVYFLVWNEAKKNFMLEPASQFVPCTH
jgi:hypothetical protein